MPCKPEHLGYCFFLLTFVATVISGFGPLFAKTRAQGTDSAATLYLVNSDANTPAFSVASHGTVCEEPNLVVITHGWYEREAWPSRMALAVSRKVSRDNWRCGWCDWRDQAKRLRPSEAATIGRDDVGPHLGREILRLSSHWRHVHLVGHSAGSWVVNAAAEIIAKETAADIHITFLDAYVPDGWDESALGRCVGQTRGRAWAEHYFTRDLLNLTESRLSHAHNVDITRVNPGFRGHRFPGYWYLATITGRYTTDERFTDKPVFSSAGNTRYGFHRALEAGPTNWKRSLILRPSHSPIAIRED